MRKCSSFMCILVVLLAGGAEAQRVLPLESLVGAFAFMGGVQAWSRDTDCMKMKDIYANGQELIENMWGNAFKYETNESIAYTMWWFEGGTPGVADAAPNPNEAMAISLGYTVPDQCHLDYYHKDVPSPEPDDFTECHPWHANSCCHDATVNTPTALNQAYGAGYEWDRCGPLSQACERFFVQEACFYECDVTAGLYRRFTNAQHAACDGQEVGHYNATLNYTCTSDGWGGVAENKWELYRMPIKASFADAWHRACANDYFCGGFDGNFFSCAASYHQQVESDAAAQERADENAANVRTAVIASVASVAGLLLLCLLCICCKEKATGTPVFTNLKDHNSKAAAATSNSA